MFSNLTAPSTDFNCSGNTVRLLSIKTPEEMSEKKEALREDKRFIHEKS